MSSPEKSMPEKSPSKSPGKSSISSGSSDGTAVDWDHIHKPVLDVLIWGPESYLVAEVKSGRLRPEDREQLRHQLLSQLTLDSSPCRVVGVLICYLGAELFIAAKDDEEITIIDVNRYPFNMGNHRFLWVAYKKRLYQCIVPSSYYIRVKTQVLKVEPSTSNEKKEKEENKKGRKSERPSTSNEQEGEGEEEEPAEETLKELKVLAKNISAKQRLSDFNKLFQMRCKYGQQYDQGREGESAQVYHNRVKIAATAIGYGDGAIKNKFIATLPSTCQANVIMSAPEDATSEQIALLAQRCLDVTGDPTREVTFAATEAKPGIEKDLDFIKEELHNLRISQDNPPDDDNSRHRPSGDSYYFRKLPMGLTLSPGIWQQRINEILKEIPNSRDFCECIHDDIILFSKSKKEHSEHLASLFQALEKHGLKISPRKCLLFRNRVNYMGHVILIDSDGLVSITPMADKCLAIRNVAVPKSPKEVRRFIGAVNYLAMFLPRLQEILRPLHQLTKKKVVFQWEESHQQAFDAIKSLLCQPPVLVAPQKHGELRLYSDTSRVATGCHLMQVIDGKERLLAYHSKRLPNAAQFYSVSELELFGLFLNVSAFKHILKSQVFQAFVDHSSLVQILQSKHEPCTTRLQKLIERLSEYSFKIGYCKGSDLQLSDFLSRAPRDDDEDFDRIMPIAFPVTSNQDNESFAFPAVRTEPIITRSYARRMGIQVPPANTLTSSIVQTRSKSSSDERTTTPAPDQRNNPVTVLSQGQQTGQRIRTDEPPENSSNCPVTGNGPARSTVILPNPPLQQQLARIPTIPNCPEPRLVDRVTEPPAHTVVNNLRKPNTGTIEVEHEHCPPTKELLTVPKPLITRIDDVIAGHIPHQRQLDKIMSIIKRKIIRDYQLPFEIQELRLAQQASPHFKPIYDYLAHNIVPGDKKAVRSVTLRSQEYILCNGVLFRLFLHNNDEDFTFQLAIPEAYIDQLISLYHDNITSMHQGYIRTYLTMRRKFHFPAMFSRICSYIQSCSRCQQHKGKPDSVRPFHPRVPDRYCPFETISMDFKSMPPSLSGFRHLMVVCCAITRYTICIPLKTIDAETVCEALIQKVFTIFGIPTMLVTDAAASLTGKLLTLLCKTLGISQKTISVENHGSLHTERQIKSIADLLKVNLAQLGNDWVKYGSVAQYAYNTFSSAHLGGYSPHYLVFLREPTDVSGLEFKLDLGLSRTYREYVEHLQAKFKHVSKTMLDIQRSHQETQNEKISQRLKKCPLYAVGQLVYLNKPSSTHLTAPSRKFKAIWCGPFAIYKCLDRTHYLLSTLDGKLLQDVFNFNRLKPAFIRATSEKENITNLQKLKDVLKKSDEVTKATSVPGNGTPRFMDENGKALDNIGNHVMHTCKTEPVDLAKHMQFAEVNNGFAAPCELSSAQQGKLLAALENAPSESEVSISRARFKAGNLQVLVSIPLNNGDYRYWWSPQWYPDSLPIVENVLSNQLLMCTGTPRKLIQRLAM
ncbi:uncharacterized protein LOC135502801 [Lineus longissimus]|uniref:uncharacterized protein LOC135502801 n=1 Tax=Lineus longissimus TaxID=88925 RepID=UPI00315DBA07